MVPSRPGRAASGPLAQANRIGSLFVNFGGPGAESVDFLQAVGTGGLFDALNQRFDVVAFDPRGVGRSEPAVDCALGPFAEDPSSVPGPTPVDVDALVAALPGAFAQASKAGLSDRVVPLGHAR